MVMRIDVYRRIKALRTQMQDEIRSLEDLRSPQVLRLSKRIDRLVMLCYQTGTGAVAGSRN